ncbi:Highly reducing polyketide synthase gloL [Colletotrichum orbiculare MAFF 240422]|uniref:Highly reducing polyketide synthase gloL n=1 Tax=Colletotrichum orbiculare (strain 104-T / ATCC 96160 / CBS 514.97 / LARS 414 / MAFF 240422) TaxID=1213857 RepID=A0A484FCX2_COLOR|nr:Highly reducing polyketide synthase gloL [Colletotrichum orbiculare MAFF 240422]
MSLFEKLRGSQVHAPATAIHRVSSNCEGIFAGETAERELLHADGVLQHVYDCLLLDTDSSAFLSLIGHKKPSLRVLEIGRSSGAKLKLEADDLVIAWNVIHATPKPYESLTNTRKLIHTHGTFLLQEVAPVTPWINHYFGVIPGWWLGEAAGRVSKPHVDIDRWKTELSQAGLGDMENRPDEYTNNNIVCRPPLPSLRPKRVKLLKRPGQQYRRIRAGLMDAGYDIDEYVLEDSTASRVPGQDIISILDESSPFLLGLDEKPFAHLQRFLKAAQSSECGILWLTGLCLVGETVQPDYAPTVGFASVTLKLDSFSSGTVTQVVPRVYGEFEKRSSDDADCNTKYEWASADGKVLVGRYRHTMLAQDSQVPPPADMTVCKLEQRKPGLTDALCWKPTTAQALKSGEVRIEVKAVGMNYKDLLIAEGVITD